MRKLMTMGVAAVVTSLAAPATAQEFGEQGTPALFAERLFGLHFTKYERDRPNNNDQEEDFQGFGLGIRAPAFTSPYEVPRVGFDYFVIDSLSIGGALAYATVEDDDDPNNDLSMFLFAPRVGYVWMFSEVVGFWLRGGFTYHSIDRDPGEDENAFALTGEGMFIISPVEHFGFIVGPTFDITFTGDRDDDDIRYRSFGLINAGVGGWF